MASLKQIFYVVLMKLRSRRVYFKSHYRSKHFCIITILRKTHQKRVCCAISQKAFVNQFKLKHKFKIRSIKRHETLNVLHPDGGAPPS